jgi:hypothetical protein
VRALTERRVVIAHPASVGAERLRWGPSATTRPCARPTV